MFSSYDKTPNLNKGVFKKRGLCCPLSLQKIPLTVNFEERQKSYGMQSIPFSCIFRGSNLALNHTVTTFLSGPTKMPLCEKKMRSQSTKQLIIGHNAADADWNKKKMLPTSRISPFAEYLYETNYSFVRLYQQFQFPLSLEHFGNNSLLTCLSCNINWKSYPLSYWNKSPLLCYTNYKKGSQTTSQPRFGGPSYEIHFRS